MDENNSKIAEALGCSEQEIEQLCEIFQKSAEELPDVLAGLNWSADRIARFAGNLASDLVAVKFEFHQPGRDGMCAILSLIFDSKIGRITEEMYWVMYGKLPPGFSVNDKWEQFREKINKIGGHFEQNQFERFRTIARSVLTKEALYAISRNDTPELRAKISADIVAASATLSPQKPECAIDIEHFSAARLDIAGVKSYREEPESTPEEEEEGFSIACLPVIDPANGKPARDIKAGDKIWVDLVDGPGLSGVVYRLLKKSGIQPMFAITSKERLDTGLLCLRFNISDEIVGTVRVSPEIRLKSADQATVESRFDVGMLKDKIAIVVAAVIATGLVVFIISLLVE